MIRIVAAQEAHLGSVWALDQAVSPVFSKISGYESLLCNDGLVLVALDDDDLLMGFAAFSHVHDESTLLNLAVEPRLWGQSVARSLLRESWRALLHRGVSRVLLEVRASNAPAQQLYKSEGFAEDGVRANYYSLKGGSREAAVLMSRNLEL